MHLVTERFRGPFDDRQAGIAAPIGRIIAMELLEERGQLVGRGQSASSLQSDVHVAQRHGPAHPGQLRRFRPRGPASGPRDQEHAPALYDLHLQRTRSRETATHLYDMLTCIDHDRYYLAPPDIPSILTIDVDALS